MGKGMSKLSRNGCFLAAGLSLAAGLCFYAIEDVRAAAGAVSCDSLDNSWSVDANPAESDPTTSSSGSDTCPPGSQRIRRIDSNNQRITKCVTAESCSGSGTTKLCTKKSAGTSFPTYHCASCQSNCGT